MAPLNRREFLAAAAGVVLTGALGGPGTAALRDLERRVSGPVFTPGEAGYAAGRRVYNARFSGARPLAVVQPRSNTDVRAVLAWASRHNVTVIPRSGGHSYAGYSTGPGLVVDLGLLRGIRVERGRGTAVVGAGSRLLDVYTTLDRAGGTIPAGSCPTVGVAGLALGGGVGFAARRLGTTSDNVVSLQIVTPDGVVRTCDRDTNPDLFWACRGGGGRNFGIVTSFRFRVSPASRASWFVATWPWEAAADAVPAWQRYAPDAPNALMSLMRFATGRPEPTLQAFGQFSGTEAALRRELATFLAAAPGARLRTGTATNMELVQRWAGCLGEPLSECGAFEPATFAAKSDYVARPWSAEPVRTVQTWIERRQGASGALLLDAYGGALSAVGPDATAFVHRNVLHSLQYLVYWTAPAAAAASLGWIRGFHAAMRPHVTGAAYQNYIDPDLRDWREAYYGANYPRLAAIRGRYDPDRRFAFPQGIR